MTVFMLQQLKYITLFSNIKTSIRPTLVYSLLSAIVLTGPVTEVELQENPLS